jgi:GTP-binding protein
LGIVEIDVDRSFVMADLPGLIEGAHAGAGMGHEFLRHIERTRLLVHLIEPQPADGTSPLENYHTIRRELEKHSANLAERPEIVVVSKADLPAAIAAQQELSQQLGGEVLAISAVTGQGLDQLRRQIITRLDANTPG